MNLMGKPPLGQKPPKADKKPRKALSARSPKKAAYMASSARVDGLNHMARVKALPCICCGHPPPSYAHHCTGGGMARDDMAVLPLCYECHQNDTGYHLNKAEWVAKHGQDYELLPRVAALLATQ